MQNKRGKVHKILSEAEAEQLIIFLNSKRGNQKELAEEIGVSEQAVAGWMKNKKFPRYCKAYLSKLKILKTLNLLLLNN